MNTKAITRSGRVIIGFVIAIIATIASLEGRYIDDNTMKYVVVMIFAFMMIDTPKEE